MSEDRPKRTPRRIYSVVAITVILIGAIGIGAMFYLRLPWIRTETVSFKNDTITLVGTLALPRWNEGPYPATVIVHGSAPFRRWTLWPDARHLVPQGMAVLMYDKRGVGDSTGNRPDFNINRVTDSETRTNAITEFGKNFDLLADDANAAIEYLRTRSEIDPGKIGLKGISQAGWIMPLAANRNGNVAFMINISGPAVSLGVEDWYSQLTGEYGRYKPGELESDEISRRLAAYNGPAGYDPLPVLKTLKVPTLLLLGAEDLSVPTSLSVTNLRPLIENGVPIDLKVYDGADHIFRSNGSLWPNVDYWPYVFVWLRDRGILKQ